MTTRKDDHMVLGRFIVTLGLFTSLMFSGLTASGSEEPRFAVYLVDLVQNESETLPAGKTRDIRYFHSYVTQEYVLANAVRQAPPIITESHIVEYCWETQRIQLTATGAQNWNSLGGFEVPLWGRPLLVVVDGEPLYGAMLWNPISSQSCKLPQIWCMTMDNRITVGGKFVTTEGDTIYAENYDPKVKQVMDELGKLGKNCAGK